MDMNTFVENAKKICHDKNISVSAACLNAGLSVSWLSDIENKGTRPRIDTVVAFSGYLKTTVSELIGETQSCSLEISKLERLNAQLNEEGQKRLLETADDMVASGKYKKDTTSKAG